MVAAHHMFAADLPPHWSEHVEENSSRVYFFNRLTGDSAWSHPQEALFKELIEEVRHWRPAESLDAIFARSDAHLRQAHSLAVQAIAQWSGPYDAPVGPEEAPEFGESAQFYFNAATGDSRWSDPRVAVEFDLGQRHSILCECIRGHTQNLAKMAASDSSDGEDDRDGRSARPPMQAIVQNLWQSVGTLPLPALTVEGVSPPPVGSGRSRPTGLPAGDDTNRSTMSYLTARSSGSCAEEAPAPISPAPPQARGDLPSDPLPNHPFVLPPQSE